jgi:thioredoxin 1
LYQLAEIKQVQGAIKNEKALMLYFFNDDCLPCKSLRPKVECLMNSKFQKMKLVWIDSKRNPEIPVAFSIFASPTILVYFEGLEFGRYGKFISLGMLEVNIRRHYHFIIDNP